MEKNKTKKEHSNICAMIMPIDNLLRLHALRCACDKQMIVVVVLVGRHPRLSIIESAQGHDLVLRRLSLHSFPPLISSCSLVSRFSIRTKGYVRRERLQ